MPQGISEARAAGIFGVLQGSTAAVSVVEIMAAVATVYCRALVDLSHRHPRQNLADFMAYDAIVLHAITGWSLAYEAACILEPQHLPEDVARLVVGTQLGMLQAAASPAVHPNQQVCCWSAIAAAGCCCSWPRSLAWDAVHLVAGMQPGCRRRRQRLLQKVSCISCGVVGAAG